jgi:hypothetical protein
MNSLPNQAAETGAKAPGFIKTKDKVSLYPDLVGEENGHTLADFQYDKKGRMGGISLAGKRSIGFDTNTTPEIQMMSCDHLSLHRMAP